MTDEDIKGSDGIKLLINVFLTYKDLHALEGGILILKDLHLWHKADLKHDHEDQHLQSLPFDCQLSEPVI